MERFVKLLGVMVWGIGLLAVGCASYQEAGSSGEEDKSSADRSLLSSHQAWQTILQFGQRLDPDKDKLSFPDECQYRFEFKRNGVVEYYEASVKKDDHYANISAAYSGPGVLNQDLYKKIAYPDEPFTTLQGIPTYLLPTGNGGYIVVGQGTLELMPLSGFSGSFYSESSNGQYNQGYLSTLSGGLGIRGELNSGYAIALQQSCGEALPDKNVDQL